MDITIHRDGCISCGSCEEKCPRVFKLDETTKSWIVPRYRRGGPDKGEIGDNLTSCVKSTRDVCPVSVLATG